MKTETDRKRLHELLIQAGSAGVNSFDATYVLSCGKQAPTRYHELKFHPIKNPQGCQMDKPKRQKNGSVNWIHLSCQYKPSVVTTQSYIQAEMEQLKPVRHANGITTWEKPEYFRQKGLSL